MRAFFVLCLLSVVALAFVQAQEPEEFETGVAAADETQNEVDISEHHIEKRAARGRRAGVRRAAGKKGGKRAVRAKKAHAKRVQKHHKRVQRNHVKTQKARAAARRAQARRNVHKRG